MVLMSSLSTHAELKRFALLKCIFYDDALTGTMSVAFGAVESGFWNLVKEDFHRHGADATAPGFLALFMYRLGVCSRDGSFVRRLCLRSLYSLLHVFVRNFLKIELHSTACIGRRLRIARTGYVVIHEHASIGDDCEILGNATIGAANHPYLDQAPVIGNNVVLSPGAAIIGKIEIGDHSMIGPRCVVMTSLPRSSRVVPPRCEVRQRPIDSPI